MVSRPDVYSKNEFLNEIHDVFEPIAEPDADDFDDTLLLLDLMFQVRPCYLQIPHKLFRLLLYFLQLVFFLTLTFDTSN